MIRIRSRRIIDFTHAQTTVNYAPISLWFQVEEVELPPLQEREAMVNQIQAMEWNKYLENRHLENN